MSVVNQHGAWLCAVGVMCLLWQRNRRYRLFIRQGVTSFADAVWKAKVKLNEEWFIETCCSLFDPLKHSGAAHRPTAFSNVKHVTAPSHRGKDPRRDQRLGSSVLATSRWVCGVMVASVSEGRNVILYKVKQSYAWPWRWRHYHRTKHGELTPTTRRHMPRDWNLQQHRCDNLKCRSQRAISKRN